MMKKLVDMEVLQTVYGGVFDLDEGYTGKVLVDDEGYFEGVVRTHKTLMDDSFVFGYMYDNGDVDFMKLAPADGTLARHVQGSNVNGCFCGKSFVRQTDAEMEDCGVLVFTTDGEKIRNIYDSEISSLETQIISLKNNLGYVGRGIYESTLMQKKGKINVK